MSFDQKQGVPFLSTVEFKSSKGSIVTSSCSRGSIVTSSRSKGSMPFGVQGPPGDSKGTFNNYPFSIINYPLDRGAVGAAGAGLLVSAVFKYNGQFCILFRIAHFQ